MRLTRFGSRKLGAVLAATGLVLAGCQRIPYIDQSKSVPHDASSSVAMVDSEVQQAAFQSQMPVQLPQLAPPRTPDNPEVLEPWFMTLEEAIQIGMANSEVIRVISLGAQGIPVTGFSPTPLSTAAGSALGAGTLSTVYDPSIQETQIAAALSAFDTQFTTQFFYQEADFLVNNQIAAGFLSVGDEELLALVRSKGAGGGVPSFSAQLTKRTATGATLRVANEIDYTFANSPIQTFPSVYESRVILQFTQPLLGGNDTSGPTGLEANRANVVISRLNADTSVWSFKAEVMAMVRSIEQQYWALSQQQIQYWSRARAVDLGARILEQEQIEERVGTGSRVDVAEAEEQFRQFQINLVQAQADLITTERQFRELLGLPPTDGRRITPVSEPTTARFEPDWETSLAQMVSYQPDIVQQQLLVRIAELQLLLARNQLLPSLSLDLLYQFNGIGQDLDTAYQVLTGQPVLSVDPIIASQQSAAGVNPASTFYNNFQTWQIGLTFSMPIGFRGELADVKAAQLALLRQRAFLQQTVHQSTHSLYRFFLEIDLNYKLLKLSGLLREAAYERLEANRVFYEIGTISIDRYLDAVNRWSDSVASEAQFKTSYNISIAALEEAKGTLLAYNNIAVAEGPNPRKASIQAIDQQRAHKVIPIPHDGPISPTPIVGPDVPDPVKPRLPLGTPARPANPNFPAPYGTRGPGPRPVAPTIPAADPTPLSSNRPLAEFFDAGVTRTANEAIAPEPLPSLPRSVGSANSRPTVPSIDLPPLPSRSLPNPQGGGNVSPDGLPPLPQEIPSIDLPPLPGR